MLPRRPSLATASDGAFVGSVVVRPFGSLAMPRPPCAFTIAGLTKHPGGGNPGGGHPGAETADRLRPTLAGSGREPKNVAEERGVVIRGPRAATSFRFIVRRGS
jgi:hypothetical protein